MGKKLYLNSIHLPKLMTTISMWQYPRSEFSFKVSPSTSEHSSGIVAICGIHKILWFLRQQLEILGKQAHNIVIFLHLGMGRVITWSFFLLMVPQWGNGTIKRLAIADDRRLDMWLGIELGILGTSPSFSLYAHLDVSRIMLVQALFPYGYKSDGYK